MMILLCKLAIKSEATRFRLLWSSTLDNEISTALLVFSIISFLTENLTSCTQISSSGPPFCTGTMGQILVTLT